MNLFVNHFLNGGGKIVKNNLLIGTTFLSLALGAASCTNDSEQLTDSRTAPMSVQVSNHIASRGLITTGTLPADEFGIGVTLVNKNDKASYDGQTGYANNQWKTANGTTWDIVGAANPNLTGTEGVAVAYYPYSSTATNYTAIPVESASQTDYMYSGWSNDLTNASPEATFTMQHALAAVRVKLVASANYTGDKSASAVTISSEGFMATASLDASTGILSSKDGAGAEHTQDNLGLTLDATGKDVDFLVIPADEAADINFIATIGGKQYAATVTPGEALAQGLIHTYTLTLSAAGMKVSTVEVTPWGEGQTGSSELTPYDPLAKYADWVKVTYEITDNSEDIWLFSSFDSRIDISEVSEIAILESGSNDTPVKVTPEHKIKFSTTGLHTVFIKFKDMTQILPKAFYNNYYMKSVYLPKSIKTIGDNAFRNAVLSSIYIPNSVTTIGQTAFYSCDKLTEIYIPTSVKFVPTETFKLCSSLEKLICGAEKIGSATFNECRKLKEVILLESVKEISYNAFCYCESLSKIISYPHEAPTIQNNTFWEIGKGGVLYIPSGANYSTWKSESEAYLGYHNWTYENITP